MGTPTFCVLRGKSIAVADSDRKLWRAGRPHIPEWIEE